MDGLCTGCYLLPTTAANCGQDRSNHLQTGNHWFCPENSDKLVGIGLLFFCVRNLLNYFNASVAISPHLSAWPLNICGDVSYANSGFDVPIYTGHLTRIIHHRIGSPSIMHGDLKRNKRIHTHSYRRWSRCLWPLGTHLASFMLRFVGCSCCFYKTHSSWPWPTVNNEMFQTDRQLRYTMYPWTKGMLCLRFGPLIQQGRRTYKALRKADRWTDVWQVEKLMPKDTSDLKRPR